MSGQIHQVLEAIMSRVQVAWPSCKWSLGASYIQAADWKPPHVVWSPSTAGDRFEPADYVGQLPRTYRTLVARLEARIRGADFEQTEILRHDVLSAILQTALGNVELTGGGWITQNQALSARGESYLALVELRLPIVEDLHGEAPTTGVATVAETPSTLALTGGDVPNTDT